MNDILKGKPVMTMDREFDGEAIIKAPIEGIPGIARDTNQPTESFRLTVSIGNEDFAFTDWALTAGQASVVRTNMNNLGAQLKLKDLGELRTNAIVGKKIHIRVSQTVKEETGQIFYNHAYTIPRNFKLEEPKPVTPKEKGKGKARVV